MLSRTAAVAQKELQGTLKSIVTCQGVGVHTGEQIKLTLHPAMPDEGVTFVRCDQGNAQIKARFENVVDTRFSTTIGNDQGVTLSTVEHLMAAFVALGIDNAFVEVSGPEIPILDGSALPFIQLIQQEGIQVQDRLRKRLKVLKTVRVEEADQYLEISPSSLFRVSVAVPLGPHLAQSYTYTSQESFTETIAAARTFSLLENVERMQAAGLIKGGSLKNAVVLDGERVVNPEGLRFPQECARHKILDIVGDFALAGVSFLGHIRGRRPGHTLNHQLLKTLMENQDAWCFEAEKPQHIASILRKSHQPVAVFAASAYN